MAHLIQSDHPTPHVLLPPENAPDAQHATPSSSVRYPWLDIARALAIVDVVAVHAGESHVLWGLGLPVFVLCSIGLAARRSPPRPWVKQVQRRSVRILLPFAFWCVVYLVFNKVYHQVADGYVFVLPQQLNAWHLLVGTEFNLWYLSFIFMAEVAVAGWLSLTRRWAGRWAMGATVCWLLLGTVWMKWAPPVESSVPVERSLESMQRAIPLVFWGMAFAVAMRNWPRTRQPLCLVAAWGILVGLTAGLWREAVPLAGSQMPGLIWAWDPEWVWRCGLALSLVCGCVVLPGVHWPKPIRSVIGLTFGIYLVHRLLIWPTWTWVEAVGAPTSWMWAYVWVQAALLAWGLQHAPGIRRFVGVM